MESTVDGESSECGAVALQGTQNSVHFTHLLQ